MPGIINQAMGNQEQMQGQTQEQVPSQEQQQGGEGKVNQQALERVVVAAAKIMHSPQTKPQLLAMMKQVDDPIQALVDGTFLIMEQISKTAKGKIPSDVLGAASYHTLVMLGELATAAKLFKATPQMLQQAAQVGIERLKQMTAERTGAANEEAALPAQESPGLPTAEATAGPGEEVY